MATSRQMRLTRSTVAADALPELPRGTWEILDHMGGWQRIDAARRDQAGDIQVDTPAMNLAYRPDAMVTIRPMPAHPE
jgi:hypothetical protein